MKHLLLIATGGTIASKSSGDGLTPGITSEELLACVPEAAEICRITAHQIFNLDSTNLQPKHWLEIAGFIHRCYAQYSRGAFLSDSKQPQTDHYHRIAEIHLCPGFRRPQEPAGRAAVCFV